MSVCLLSWVFVLFGCLIDGLVEYSVGTWLVYAFARLGVCFMFVYCFVYCLLDLLTA